MDAPILLVVDEDQAVLEALSGDLGRRFGVDYRILAEPGRRRSWPSGSSAANGSRGHISCGRS